MKQIILFLIPGLVLFSCKNQKAEVIDQLRVATKNLEKAEIMFSKAEDVHNRQYRAIGGEVAPDQLNAVQLDSLNTRMQGWKEEKDKWKPIVDSLNWELKKYQ